MEMPEDPYTATSTVEHLPVGIGLLDAHDFCLLTANPLFLTFLGPAGRSGQALGRPVPEWLPRAEEIGVMEIVRTVASSGLPYHADMYPFPALKRGFTYWNWRLEALRDPDGRIRYLLCTSYDMTGFVWARRRAEIAREARRQGHTGSEVGCRQGDPAFLQQFVRDKPSLLAMLSHELRTPMTVIIGYIELLEILTSQGEHLEAQQFQQVFAQLGQQSSHFVRLLEAMQELARLKTGQRAPRIGSCDLLSLLRRLLEQMEPALEGRRICLQLEGVAPDEPLPIRACPREITRIFENLLNNALKYSPAQKEIVLGVRLASEHPGEVVCRVQDEGIGIAEADLPCVFTCFYRAPQARYATRGLGIGLYLVKELVEFYGGRVWAESRPAQGSTFFVALPVLAAAGEHAVSVPSRIHQARS
jgi:signal transduction histidine kinase